MTLQQWSTVSYQANAAFVQDLAGVVVGWLEPGEGEKILDLGCGDGRLTERLAAGGASMVGVDLSAEMVSAARARGVEAFVASAEALPFADGAFAAVFSNAVLHWVRDHDAMLREVNRVLSPEGRFVAEFGGHGNVAAILVGFRAVLARHGLSALETGVNYYPTPEVYRERLVRHGFTVDRIELVPRPTALAESGMKSWLETFRRGVLDRIAEPMREAVVRETVELLRPSLCDERGHWSADYVRLRFAARKA